MVPAHSSERSTSQPIDEGDTATRVAAQTHSGFGFCTPRFWPAWGLYAWMRITSAMPLSLSLAIHRVLGRVLHRFAKRQRRVVLRNLELCFPELGPRELASLGKRAFEAVGMSFAECAMAWFGSDERIARRFDIVGIEHLRSALAQGRGVILYTGHFTSLEICGRAFKRLTPQFACMFSRRSNALLDEIQRRGRLRIAHEIIPRDNVRMMLRSLKRNAVVWYAPDQVYDGGELVQFFHELAMTNVATSKLARLTGAAVVPFSYHRLEGKARYELRFHPPLDEFPTQDPVADTRRLMQILEEFIRECPDQYLWTHRKYKGRPAPLPDLYKRQLSTKSDCSTTLDVP